MGGKQVSKADRLWERVKQQYICMVFLSSDDRSRPGVGWMESTPGGLPANLLMPVPALRLQRQHPLGGTLHNFFQLGTWNPGKVWKFWKILREG